MNKFFVSIGLVAVGTASLQAAYAPDLGPTQTSKMWSIAGSLRGFYDDNYLTAPNGSKRGSYGFEVSPQVALNVPLQQTELGLRYTYGMYYYQDRQDLGQNPVDQTHQLDLWVDHAFTERWQSTVQDSFVVGQEPQLIGGGQTFRVEGNNIRNTATVNLNTIWTRLLSTKLSYQNSIYDYQNNNGTAAQPSLAGTLNRIEQNASLDLQWQVRPETVAFVGGMVGFVNYTANEPIGAYGVGPTIIYSDERDNRSYFGYVGLQHNFLANLSFNGKAGFQYTDNYNDPSQSSSVNPYADISLIYTYLPGSYAQIGFSQGENASYWVNPTATGNISLFQETSTLYASINHQLTAKLLGSVIGQWAHMVYSGGTFNNQADDYYTLGLNLAYTITTHISAEVGYNFDYLQSAVPGFGYSRNRVYLGVSASY